MRDNPLIVALDVPTGAEAQALAARLRGRVGMFKIGKQLFTAAGPSIVRRLIEAGDEVFLDLKFHDIPQTVAMAGVEAARLGARIFNLHALGGREMMARTVEAIGEAAAREGLRRPLLVGVTVLTSHDQASLGEVGITEPLRDEVIRLARLCQAAGVDGVVASPEEIALLRAAVEQPGFVIITPGVRPMGASRDDQSRVRTPGEAIREGADYLVIGRPITAAPDPVEAAEKILEEIELAAGRDV